MKLVDDWKWIATKAWSIRFAALAAVSALGDAVLPLLSEDVPHRMFVALTSISTILSVAARFIPQKRDDD